MKRVHIHLHVTDLDASVAFYSQMFGRGPDRLEADYAKWLEDEPALNLALSTGHGEAVVSHLGIQVDDREALEQLRQRATTVDLERLDQQDAACCYARSDKSWIQDPDGLPWEFFETHGQLATFGEDRMTSAAKNAEETGEACCAPSCCGA